MRRWQAGLLLAPLVLLVFLLIPQRHRPVRVGSKGFTESVILGELLTQLINRTPATARHRAQLGGTRVLWNALLDGDLDIYPEYTGTLSREILAGQGLHTSAQLRQAVAALGLGMSRPVGFNNSYAIGVRRDTAAALELSSISDLRAHPQLRLGFTNEFMDRGDGWPSLQSTYRLPHADVRGIDHDIAYQALINGAIDVTDLYTTDAKIDKYDLVILQDDLQHFPSYEAVILYRADLQHRHPQVVEAIRQLEGAIDERQMIQLNAQVELQHRPERTVAADFLRERFDVAVLAPQRTLTTRLMQNTREHIRLVLISLLAAIVVAIPLGIWSARKPAQGQIILAGVGIIQTIPALALLVVLMKPLSLLAEQATWLRQFGVSGIGSAPAIVALFLYSLLPIVRNTAAGLTQISPDLCESAQALGLPGSARLRLIELPLAGQTILAGIKTAAVVNIGFATLGALIGAGGYGQPILTGIRLNSYSLILQGALPAAVLAIATQLWFELAERVLLPRGLRLKLGD